MVPFGFEAAMGDRSVEINRRGEDEWRGIGVLSVWIRVPISPSFSFLATRERSSFSATKRSEPIDSNFFWSSCFFRAASAIPPRSCLKPATFFPEGLDVSLRWDRSAAEPHPRWLSCAA